MTIVTSFCWDVHAVVHNLLRDFDNEALNGELTDAPLFHGQKLYSVSNFRGKNSWNEKCWTVFKLVFGPEKKIQF